jgi:hypothetical protein
MRECQQLFHCARRLVLLVWQMNLMNDSTVRVAR